MPETVPSQDCYFQSIECSNIDQCQPLLDAEVFAAHDRFLREPCGVVATQEREKACGFAVEPPQGLLASSERTLPLLPPSLAIYDPCHNYWANGIVAQEILSFCKAMERTTVLPATDTGRGESRTLDTMLDEAL